MHSLIMALSEGIELHIKDMGDINHVGNSKDTNENSRRTVEVQSDRKEDNKNSEMLK